MPPRETHSAAHGRSDLAMVVGTGVVLLAVAAIALGVSPNPVDGAAVGAFGVAAVQVALLLAAGAYLLSHERTRLYGQLAVVFAVVVTAQAIVVSSLSAGSGLSILLRSPVGLLTAVGIALFDTGRPSTKVDRYVTLPAVAVEFALFVAVLLTSSVRPGAWAGLPCVDGCPATGLGLVDSPGLSAGLQAAYAVVRVLAFGAMAVGVVVRLRGARGLQRSVMAPVAVVGLVYAGIAIAVVLPAIGGLGAPLAPWVDPALIISRLIAPVGIAAAIVIGAVGTTRVQQVDSAAIRGARTIDEARDLMRAVLADPGLSLLPAAKRPHAQPGHQVVRLDGVDGRPVGWLVHAPGLADAQPLVYPEVLPALAVAMDQITLSGEIAAREEQLDDLRMALAAAGDAERARIEQDIHDGAQARLILLRARVRGLARAAGDDDALAAQMAILERDVDAALADIRGIASGLRPLRRGELVVALRDHTMSLAFDVRVVDHGIGDLPDRVELAAHYCLREALQNVAKHAGPGASARVELGRDESGAVWFRVDDDGRGMTEHPDPGAGLSGMRRRITEVGGTFEVGPSPAGGVRVRAVIPRVAGLAAPEDQAGESRLAR